MLRGFASFPTAQQVGETRRRDRDGVAAGSGGGRDGDGGGVKGGSLLVGVFDGHGNAGHKVSRAAAKALQKALDRNLARGSPGKQQPSASTLSPIWVPTNRRM